MIDQAIMEQFSIFKNPDNSLTYVHENGKSVNMFKCLDGAIELNNTIGQIIIQDTDDESLLQIVEYMAIADKRANG